MQSIRFAVSLSFILFTAPSLVFADGQEQLHVGIQPDGRIVVPTNQILDPAGTQITFPGRPVDLALSDDGKTLIVKNVKDLVIIDVATGRIKQTLTIPQLRKNQPGFSVVGLLVVGGTIYVTDADSSLRIARRKADGEYQWLESQELTAPAIAGASHPAGIARLPSGELLVTSTRGNNVQVINETTGKIEHVIQVGVAPYMISVRDPECYYVSNWGGDPPGKNDHQALSSKTPIRIDSRTGIANHGTVSVLNKVQGQWKQRKTIPVGLHPCGMTLSKGGKFLYVANANSDTVSVIETAADMVVETIACRPEARLPFGSGSNALALSPDGATLYVANGTNNCVAVVRLGTDSCERAGEINGRDKGATGRPAPSAGSQLIGLIPTGWYPGAVLVSSDGKKLFVANVKGHGSLAQKPGLEKKKNSKQFLGSVSIIDIPNDAQLAEMTKRVNANNRLAYSLAGLDKPRSGVAPKVIPDRHGEPSLVKHVIYIIKENRTYDQVFGDMKEGNGDSNLVMFGEKVTPNHHALARQFTLFDNFYCSGVISADGHSWCNEAYVTDYLEKAFGGFTRSYPDDGSDPLAYPATGFLWDNALAHGKTFRNFGEFVHPDYCPKETKWAQIYEDHKNGTQKVKLDVKAQIKSLEPYTHPRYPWFPLLTPDVYRARLFIEELRTYEQKGEMPNLIYLTLPCDHTTGTDPDYPTPRASVADNDLALGRIVEAVSRSKFWRDTCIFVVEDDPQDGFDHVDAHRTVALAISPYTKRQFVDHTNYNQTGMVKTIELILGLPPMNQLDLSATAMRNCFQDVPDLTPYSCLPNLIALDEMNPPLKRLQGKALEWAKKSLALNLHDGDAADEDTLNRILWYATRGYDAPYPEQFATGDEDD
jgi:YVTN family beta-propeller protein